MREIKTLAQNRFKCVGTWESARTCTLSLLIEYRSSSTEVQTEEVTMVSKLSKRLEELELRLRQHEGTERDLSHKAVLELTSFVYELSRKIDQIEAASA
jgi:hypothetical protein